MQKIEELNSLWLNRLFVLILIFKAFSYEKAFSQSYISNGDFEVISKCPQFWSERVKDFTVENWYSPTKSTPDVFSKCSEQCNHHSNWMDKNVKALSESYVGIITRQKGKDYSEYIQTKLSTDLIAGQFYKIKMDIYWPENSLYKPVKIGALLSESKISSSKESYIKADHAIYSKIVFDTIAKSKWVSIEIEIKATGNEKYITIGSFERTSEFNKSSSGSFDYNYLFIDNVSLQPSEFNMSPTGVAIHPNVISSFEYLDEIVQSHQSGNCTCWNCQILNGKVDKDVSKLEDLTGFELREGQRVDLNKVIFDYNDGSLQAQSNAELNRLMFVLEEQPKAELRFVIYTYASNDEGKVIAKESALTIYEFLKEKGLKNSFSYIHAVKESLSQTDNIPRDRNIEMYVVSNN